MVRQSRSNGEDLERRILYGLVCEWEVALSVLNASHRDSMRPPLFRLGQMKSRWGTWSPEKREISLCRNLVMNHSWDSVREVLLHEMAHQLAHEVLGAHNERPHGPTFHRACFLLRADPQASGRYPPLDERVAMKSAAPEDKTMSRIRKLMALAESSNRHEAEAAMSKAHELMERFNIDLISRDRIRRFYSVFVGHPALRHPREDYVLALLLQDFYFVQGIWVPAFVLGKGKMGRVLEISGTRGNVKIAAYVHDFIRNYTDNQWARYNLGKRLNRYRKTDFTVGILDGFRSKLEANTSRGAKETHKSSKALVETDLLLTKYLAHRYPHTENVSRYVTGCDSQVIKDGEAAGKDLVVHRGITRRGRKGGFLPNMK